MKFVLIWGGEGHDVFGDGLGLHELLKTETLVFYKSN